MTRILCPAEVTACNCVINHTGYPCPVLPSGWDQLADVARIELDNHYLDLLSGPPLRPCNVVLLP